MNIKSNQPAIVNSSNSPTRFTNPKFLKKVGLFFFILLRILNIYSSFTDLRSKTKLIKNRKFLITKLLVELIIVIVSINLYIVDSDI